MDSTPKEILTWVFDLDGTLVEGDPYESVLKYVARRSGKSLKTLLHVYRRQWKGLDDAMAYHIGLVALPRQKGAIRERYARFVRAKSHPTVHPDSRDILERLRNQGKRLICWTRGDEKKQQIVLCNSGLSSLFHLIIVPGSKDNESVERLLMPHVRGVPFALVGDSYEQDIVPVLDAASALFWIAESKANRIANADSIRPDPRVTRLKSIRDLPPYL